MVGKRAPPRGASCARAPIVVGADGKQSWVAHQVSAPYTHYAAPVSIAYFTYWTGATVDSLLLEFATGRLAGIFPTNDGLALAFVQCRWSERHAFRADVTASYLAALDAFPRATRRTTRIRSSRAE